jgi:lipopolysaccharide transport system ATP-binding protein
VKAIEIHSVGKQYQLFKKNTSIRHLFEDWFYKKKQSVESAAFWALRDISFDINFGEVLGIVGRNGAGKSTLLKILSRITPPTTGKVVVNGRLASLLEVGTGFHPELTGRENVFMNGTILGLKRHEIIRKFDEIVAFSGIEKFIDTPVKYYSSGMYIRLAFAVAAHLESEILIIDEVLAVGDAEFQKKCLGKMQDVTNSGRTIVFVSHNLPAIETLCKKCIYLVKGELKAVGNTGDVLTQYLSTDAYHKPEIQFSEGNRPGDDFVRLISVRILNSNRQPSVLIEFEKPCIIEMTYEVLKPGVEPVPNLHFIKTGMDAFCSVMPLHEDMPKVGRHIAVVEIPAYFFNTGLYFLTVACSTTLPIIVHFQLNELLSFEVIENLDLRETHYKGDYPGVVRTKFKWEHSLNSYLYA